MSEETLQASAGGAPEAGNKARDVEHSIVKKFRKPIWSKFTKAIKEYDLLQPGDKIAVCMSGGKDSMLLAKLFQELKKHGEDNFGLEFLVMDPGYRDENYRKIIENAQLLDIPITVFEAPIFDAVSKEIHSPCYLCARMRRGYLYSKAQELGCNKIALGHHFDDVIETVLISMLYGGQMQSMPPKLRAKNFPGMELIRPLYMVREQDIIAWKDAMGLSFIQCACRFTEGAAAGEHESKRQEVKRLIQRLHEENPVVEQNIFGSIHNVQLDTMAGWKYKGKEVSFLDDYDE